MRSDELYRLPEYGEVVPYEELCPFCGNEVYEGERLYRYEGRYICEACLCDSVRYMTAEEIAKFADLKVRICGADMEF